MHPLIRGPTTGNNRVFGLTVRQFKLDGGSVMRATNRVNLMTVFAVAALLLTLFAPAAPAIAQNDEFYGTEYGVLTFNDRDDFEDVEDCTGSYSSDLTASPHPAVSQMYAVGAEHVCLWLDDEYTLLIFGAVGHHDDRLLTRVALGCDAVGDGWIVLEEVFGLVQVVHDDWALSSWHALHDADPYEHVHVVPPSWVDDFEGPEYPDVNVCTLHDYDG